MSRETIWMIVAGLSALIAVTLIYMGLQNGTDTLVIVGFCLFALGMIINPVMRIAKGRKEKSQAKADETAMRRA